MNKMEVLLKEYDSLRAEVSERIKIAFSHMGYVGAIVAFAYPVADKVQHRDTIMLLAVVGGAILFYIAYLNWSWVDTIASHLRTLEKRINDELATDKDGPVLTWESVAEDVSQGIFRPPKRRSGGH